jgi:hypothetical protein
MTGASRSALNPGATSPRHMSHTPFRITCNLQVPAWVTSPPLSLRLLNRAPRRRLAFAHMGHPDRRRRRRSEAGGGAAAGEGRYAPHRHHHRVATPSPHPVAAMWCLPTRPGERQSRRSGPTRASTSTPRVRVACRHQNACILQVSRSLTIAYLRLVCCDCHRRCRLHFAGDEKRGGEDYVVAAEDPMRLRIRCGQGSDAIEGPMRSRVCSDEAGRSRLLMTSPGGGRHPRAGVLPVGQASGWRACPA